MKYLALFVLLCVTVLTATATTLEEVEVVCAVCGTKSTQVVVMSTNRFGSPDLDLRPPEMMRSTMRYWVQHCPSCGYCSSDIGELSANAEATVKTPRYIDTLGDAGEKYFEQSGGDELMACDVARRAGDFVKRPRTPVRASL